MAFWVQQKEIVPPKIFNFSWDLQSQIEIEKKAHAKLLGDNKEYYGIFEKGLLRTYILSLILFEIS